jgi:hypothetical protein
MRHPNSLELEAFACGERRAATREHLAGCAECAAFVTRLEEQVARGPSPDAAAALIARIQASGVHDTPPKRGNVVWLHAFRRVAPAFALAAAGLALWFGSHPFGVATPAFEDAPSEPFRSTGGRIQMAPFPNPSRLPGGETTFKGGVQLAVVRERDGRQSRLTSRVTVRSGDRLRVEVALDRDVAILAAVLADDGSYLELMAPTQRARGTHFSEKSARIDDRPSGGVLVVGTPAEVARARSQKDFSGLVSLRIEWEPLP